MLKSNRMFLIISVAILIVIIGAFSGDLFVTGYQDTEMEAFNFISEDIKIESKITSVEIENVSIFLGKTDENHFVICPLKIKDGKYSAKGDYSEFLYPEESSAEFFVINSKKYYYTLSTHEKYKDDVYVSESFDVDGTSYQLFVWLE